MAKNIEINYNTGLEYELLYPTTLDRLLVNTECFTILKSDTIIMEAVTVDYFELSDIVGNYGQIIVVIYAACYNSTAENNGGIIEVSFKETDVNTSSALFVAYGSIETDLDQFTQYFFGRRTLALCQNWGAGIYINAVTKSSYNEDETSTATFTTVGWRADCDKIWFRVRYKTKLRCEVYAKKV